LIRLHLIEARLAHANVIEVGLAVILATRLPGQLPLDCMFLAVDLVADINSFNHNRVWVTIGVETVVERLVVTAIEVAGA
jgi:hypothetical protein